MFNVNIGNSLLILCAKKCKYWLVLKSFENITGVRFFEPQCTLHHNYITLISWRATFRCCQMCWLLVLFNKVMTYCMCVRKVTCFIDAPCRPVMTWRTCCCPHLSSASRNSWNCWGDVRLSTDSNFSFALNDVCSALMSSLSTLLTTWSE